MKTALAAVVVIGGALLAFTFPAAQPSWWFATNMIGCRGGDVVLLDPGCTIVGERESETFLSISVGHKKEMGRP
jgi:hypothetical protein